jgi:hypothetical protein
MSNSRKSFIPEGTVKSPGTSLVESIINRDRAQTGRAKVEEQAGSSESNIASNIATQPEEAPPTEKRAQKPRASRKSASPTAVVGSRRRIPMTTITVRIPTELNEWIADLVHARNADGITKQDVIVSAIRLLREHEEAAPSAE